MSLFAQIVVEGLINQINKIRDKMLSGSKRANSQTIETDLSIQNLYYCGAKEISGPDHNKLYKIGILERYINSFHKAPKMEKTKLKTKQAKTQLFQ